MVFASDWLDKSMRKDEIMELHQQRRNLINDVFAGNIVNSDYSAGLVQINKRIEKLYFEGRQ